MVRTRSQKAKYSKAKAAKKVESIKFKEEQAKKEVRNSVGYLRNFEDFWAQNKPILSSQYSWDRDISMKVEQSTAREVKNLKQID